MSFTLRIFIGLLFLGCLVPGLSSGQSRYEQDVRKAYEKVKAGYGMDPSLINGRYFEDIYRNDLGHPYLGKDDYRPGFVVLRNVRFDTIRLKYNIYNQSLVILPSVSGQTGFAIVPPNEFISEFSIGGELFQRYAPAGRKPGFYHSEYAGQNLSILYGWSKKAYESYHNGTFLAQKFTEPQKKYYLLVQGRLLSFSSNRSFIRKFREDHQKILSGFLKEHKINLKRPQTSALVGLGTFCDELLTGGTRNE